MSISSTLGLQLGHFVLRYRWWIIALTVILVLFAASGGRYLVFNNDYRVFFNEDNPELLAFEHMENTYNGRDENVLIVLAPKNGDVFTRENLAVIEKYTELAWQTPHSIRVDSLTNFQHSYASEDDLVIEKLVTDADDIADVDLQQIRATALSDPLLVKRLVSDDGRVTGINITIQLPGKDPVAEEPEVVHFARDLAEQIRTENPDMDVHLTGMVMLNAAFAEASEHDMSTLMPLTLLVFLISIAMLTRGWTSAFASLWMILFSILVAMGLAGWFGIDLTSISASAPTIILTLAIANAIHVLVAFLHEMKLGRDKADAMRESLRVNLQPVFLVSFTTMLGFLTMNFSESPVFHGLGNIVAMGMLCSFILSVTFLPALMMVLPVSTPAPSKADKKNAMENLAEFVIRNQNKLLIGVGGLFFVLVFFLPRNELNDEWIQYFGEGMEFRQATDFTTDNLTGVYRIDYSLNAQETDGISDPQFLRQVQAFVDWYRAQPEVVQVSALTDIMTRLNKNMNNDDPAFAVLPESRELAAQYLLLYEMSLPYGLDLNNQINIDKSATRVTVTTTNLPVKETLALEERAQEWLQANAPDIRGDGTGSTIMFAHVGVRNIQGMLLGTAIGLIFISAILLYVFRSVKMGLISLIPNLMPSIMGFGLWGLLVGEVGLGLATVAGVTMGIVVDDTIHFLSKYLRARREKGLNSEDAVRYAFASVGTALWFTTVTLVAGFAVLAFSSFKLNADMGVLTAIILIFALIADFLLLPPLLMKLDRSPAAAPVAQEHSAAQNNPITQSRPIDTVYASSAVDNEPVKV